MSIELSKCLCSSEAIDIISTSLGYNTICGTCGFRSSECDTPDEAAAAWNDLCEWIRVGKAALEHVEYGERLSPRDPLLIGLTAESFRLEFFVEPVPAPVLDPLDVLREIGEVAESRIMHQNFEAGRATWHAMKEKIDTVLAQASNKETS